MTADAHPGRLTIAVSRHNGSVLVRAEGEVDLDNAEQLATALRSASEEQAETIVLDLVGVPFMDSSGLKVLLIASRDLGDRLTLAITPGSPVVTLLKLAEVHDRLSVHATPEAAMRSRGGPG